MCLYGAMHFSNMTVSYVLTYFYFNRYELKSASLSNFNILFTNLMIHASEGLCLHRSWHLHDKDFCFRIWCALAICPVFISDWIQQLSIISSILKAFVHLVIWSRLHLSSSKAWKLYKNGKINVTIGLNGTESFMSYVDFDCTGCWLKNRRKLKAKILKVLIHLWCSIMRITCNKIDFSILKMLKMINLFT